MQVDLGRRGQRPVMSVVDVNRMIEASIKKLTVAVSEADAIAIKDTCLAFATAVALRLFTSLTKD